jgi:hypothetical protein
VDTCLPGKPGEVYIAPRFPAAPRGVPRERVLFARHSYNNPVKYVDPSGHWACQDPQGCLELAAVPWTIPQESGFREDKQLQPRLSRAAIYGLMARELGPHDDMGNSLVDEVFDPFPVDIYSDENVTSFYSELLHDVYGGWEGLSIHVAEACAAPFPRDRCQNYVLESVWAEAELLSDKTSLAFTLAGSQADPELVAFTDELNLDLKNNLYNFEPFWISELMRQYPEELSRAKLNWVLEVYLENRVPWDYLRRTGGVRPFTHYDVQ